MLRILALSAVLGLTGCQAMQTITIQVTPDVDESYLHKMQGWRAKDLAAEDEKDKIGIRKAAMQEAALAVGTQAGLAAKMNVLRDRLENHEASLSKAFDFQSMMLHKQTVIPPVITEANNTIVMGEDSLRIAGKTYQILKQAKLTTLPPSWQSYLLMGNYPFPKPPNAVLLPRDMEEQDLWADWIAEGWYAGIEQADTIMKINIARLQRDFVGMVRYHLLVLRGQVSASMLSEAKNAVLGDADKLVIDNQLLRLTQLPSMDINPANWKALPNLPSLIEPY